MWVLLLAATVVLQVGAPEALFSLIVGPGIKLKITKIKLKPVDEKELLYI